MHEELTKSWMAPFTAEAARPSPPTSLPSMAGLPGGTRAFPRWERATSPLGGTVRKDFDKARFLDDPHLPGGAVQRHRRGLCPAVHGSTAADRCDPAHPAPVWCTEQRCPPGAGLSPARRCGALLRPPELLRPRLNQHLGRRIEPLAGERRPHVPARLQVVQEVDEAALKQATQRVGVCSFSGGPGGECCVSFVSVRPPLVQGPAVPTYSKKEHFLFLRVLRSMGTTVCDALLPRSSPTTHLCQQPRQCCFGGRSPSPRTSSQSRLGPREFGKDASETRCLLYHPALLPFAAQPHYCYPTHRKWLAQGRTVESCEGVRCRPARSSADVCQRGAVR